MGIILIAALPGLSLSKINFLALKKIIKANVAAIKGEVTQLPAMPPTVFHDTKLGPLEMQTNPIIAPTIE